MVTHYCINVAVLAKQSSTPRRARLTMFLMRKCRHSNLLALGCLTALVLVYTWRNTAVVKLAWIFKAPESEPIQFRVSLPVGTYHSLKPGVCILPEFPLWPPAFIPHFQKLAMIQCDANGKDWIHVDRGRFIISREAIERHGVIRCMYIPFSRLDEYNNTWGNPVPDVKSGYQLQTDFFWAHCYANDSSRYNNSHVAIARKPEPATTPINTQSKTRRLNILVIGFDSVSRLTWLRNLPRTYAYLVKNLGAVVLKGYNIVGDDTTAALLPILTGHSAHELAEARRRRKGAQHVDGFPWIWKRLKKLGYITQYAEDRNCCNTFTHGMLGFKDQPVDHYFRPYTIDISKHVGHHQPLCARSVRRHVVFLDYARQLFRTYPKQTRKFSFLFHTELSNSRSDHLQLADDDFTEFLTNMNAEGHLDDTVLIAMSDHGARYPFIRYTFQGNTLSI